MPGVIKTDGTTKRGAIATELCAVAAACVRRKGTWRKWSRQGKISWHTLLWVPCIREGGRTTVCSEEAQAAAELAAVLIGSDRKG